MRVGHNPLRESKVTPPAPVQFCIVTHLPNREGYHSQRLDVIKLCLTSLRKHSGVGQINIWDNGSCPVLLDWLQDEFRPDRLILSRNVGKIWAQNALIRMFPSDTLIGYSDDDVLFSPGFVEEQLTILQTYPNAACVSAAPIRTMQNWACASTLKWAQENAIVKVGRFIQESDERDYAISIGRDPDYHMQMTKDYKDHKITYNGVDALAISHHVQYMGYQKMLVKATETTYDGNAMGDMKPFDEALARAGLRLATPRRFVRHIGNVIDESVWNQAMDEGVL